MSFVSAMKAYLISTIPGAVTAVSGIGSVEVYSSQEARINPQPFSCQVVYKGPLPVRRDTGVLRHSWVLILSLTGWDDEDALFSALEAAGKEIVDLLDSDTTALNAGLITYKVDRARCYRGSDLASIGRYNRRISIILETDEMES